MYEELIQRLRETSMDFGEADHVSVMLLEAANAIEDLTNKVMQAENDSGLYDDLPMMVLSEAKEPPKEE